MTIRCVEKIVLSLTAALWRPLPRRVALLFASCAMLTAMFSHAEADEPPLGRSQFDYLIGQAPVPFPFARLLQLINAQLAPELGLPPVKVTFIPLGRSLQRGAGAPDFFRYPRVVLAVDGEAKPGQVALKDRMFLGYHEKAGVLEVISYNEAAGRFEFQVVQDYRAGARPKIYYARREICLSCHQNQAPMFARPLWDETSANPAIAARLKAAGGDLYGLKLTGTDVAYLIDAATKRANLIPVWQRIWREGCGEGAAGDACRSALFTAALRYGLSGVLPDSTLVMQIAPGLDQRFAQRWPRGLAIPNADLPNRDPLALLAGSDIDLVRERLPIELATLAHIPARVEPLNPRPPLEVWAGPEEARLIVGLASLLDRSDLQALDQNLAANASSQPRQSLALACRIRYKDATRRATLHCAGQGARLSAALYFQGRKAQGRVSEMIVSGALAPTALTLSGDTPRAGRAAHFALHRDGLRARLADGRVLEQLILSPIAAGEASATLHLGDDFSRVNAALQKMTPGPSGPFQARLWMAQLAEALGLSYPQHTARALPAVQVQPSAAALVGGSGMQGSFRRYCGQCHDTGEPFPPNFLQGDAAQVTANIDHCAERIFYRLSMWAIPENKRGKTPMPPTSALRQHGFDAEHWARARELAGLRAYVTQRLAAEGDPQRLLRQPFESLRRCLPPGVVHGVP
ncbi:MAG: hypothetical protein AABY73_04275 [Pseudomonadota bacterium]